MQQQETYQNDSYRTYEVERTDPTDLSRKSPEHREVEMKYDFE